MSENYCSNDKVKQMSSSLKEALNLLKQIGAVNTKVIGSRNILYLMKEWIQNRQRPTLFCRKPKFISQDE